MSRFGFGTRLSPDFPGESAGIVWDPARWTESTLASVSMGYEISVTPLQMAAAVSAVANGGLLQQPRAVRAVVSGGRRAPVASKTIRHAVDADTAAELTSLMEAVVERGTGTAAQIPGYIVAGKTGTARKVVDGRYSVSQYNASFVGFVPSRQPVLTVVVVIDTPKNGGYYGGTVAAPVFKRIAEAALLHLGVSPTLNPIPPVLATRSAAVSAPRPAAVLVGSAPWELAARDAGDAEGLPNVVGLGAREAVHLLAGLGVSSTMHGDGVVVAQDPPAGTPIASGRHLPPLAGTRRVAPADRVAPMTLDALIAELRGRWPDRAQVAGAPSAAATRTVRAIAYDSRKAGAGSVFVAMKGQRSDGSQFALDAIERGSLAVVSESKPPDGIAVPWIVVPDARLALAVLAAALYRHPSRELEVVGITGTNGKTTTVYLVAGMLDAAGLPCGLIGTIVYRVGARQVDAPRTTPEAPDVQQLLRQMVEAGCRAAAMEVSSHALALARVDEVRFAAGVFTNLTRDHLDFHGDMDSYFTAKRRLFEMLPPGAPSIVNLDDARGSALAASVGRPLTYAVDRAADVRPHEPLRFSMRGLRFEADTPAGRLDIDSPMVGRPNAYNLLAAAATGVALGLGLDAIRSGLSRIAGVPGRFEVVSNPDDDVTAVVDYAHTDDALRNLLETTRPLAGRRIITVFGCGGDRDRTKRPLMGAVAARLSDVVVITSDNPRSEDPGAIVDEIKRGISPATGRGGETARDGLRASSECLTIVDRRAAIDEAFRLAQQGDTIVIAGKGHEHYQEVGGRTLAFDDAAVAREALARRRSGGGGTASDARKEG